jgi:hypothetical protein
VTKPRVGVRSTAVLAAFVSLSSILYLPALRGEFVSDDLNAIVLNEQVHARASALTLFTTFSTARSRHGRLHVSAILPG